MRTTKHRIPRRLAAGVWLLLAMCCGCVRPAAAQGRSGRLDSGNVSSSTLSITQEERAALDGYGALRVVVPSGAAPITHVNDNGEYDGIIRLLSDHIAELLGVEFQYVVFNGIAEALEAVAQEENTLCLTEAAYASAAPGLTLTTDPVLTANLAMFYNIAVQPGELEGKLYAMVEGDTPPEGVDNILLCGDRMAAIEAVNDGRADYGYGNEFSVNYYSNLRGFEDLSVIPTYTGTREYRYGVLNGDALLCSALNKAIAFMIENHELEPIIVAACTIPSVKMNLQIFVERHAVLFLILAGLLISGTLALVLYFYRVTRQLSVINEEYRVIAEMSGDLGFGYNVQTRTLRPSRLFCEAFGIPYGGKYPGPEALKGILDIAEIIDKRVNREELALSGGRIYEAVYAFITDRHKRLVVVIGSLTDVTERRQQLSALTQKAEVDGLTGVLNSATVREAIQQRLDAFVPGQTDAMFFIDLNRFKAINDTYGHHMGDLILTRTAQAVAGVMRKQDIVGRLGGDEFIVYAQAIESTETARKIRDKLFQATTLTLETDGMTISSSASIGCHIISEPLDFEAAYRVADEDMYAVKKRGIPVSH